MLQPAVATFSAPSDLSKASDQVVLTLGSVFWISFLMITTAATLPACSVPQFESALASPVEPAAELLDHGHYRRALSVLSADPTTGETTAAGRNRHDLLLSRIQLGLGQFDSALEIADKLIAADSSNAAFHVQAAAVNGELAVHASMFKQIGYAKRARKELDAALTLDPKNADAIYGLMIYDQNAPSFIGGDKLAAQKLSEQLTAIDPARGYRAQAALAHDRKDAAAEEALLRKAVAADANNYEAQVALATFLERAGPTHADEAAEHACLALQIDAGRTDSWQILAALAAADGCVREVDGLVTTAERFDPDDVSPYYAAAVEYLGAGKHLDAAGLLLQHYLDKPQEGDRPSGGRARYQLALVSEKLGHVEQALEQIHLALREDPALDDARKDLKRLEHAR